jgi:hypothetical protein
MSNFIDSIEKGAQKVTHYMEEHPWAAIACGAWPVKIEGKADAAQAGKLTQGADGTAGTKGTEETKATGKAPGSEVVPSGGDGSLKPKEGDSKAPAIPLSAPEKQSVSNIESAILAGDFDRLQNEMHHYAGRAGDLTNVMHQVTRDLKKNGLLVSYDHGQMQWGDEQATHDEGALVLFGVDGGLALEVRTGARDGACVGGPIEKMPDGSYVDGLLGYNVDPAKFLKELVGKK